MISKHDLNYSFYPINYIGFLFTYLIFYRWWKDLNVQTNFPYARDRIVECYFWTLGAYFEPQFNVGRKILTKVIAISSILDDTYDAYGTFEELEIFTQAIQRSYEFILILTYVLINLLFFKNTVQTSTKI